MPRCKVQAKPIAFQPSTPEGIMAAIHIANLPPIPRDDMEQALGYPLAYADEMLECTTVFGDPDPPRVPTASEFESCIKDVMYIKEGEHAEDDWVMLGTLVGGGWFYYTASCDNTGFDCQGGMSCVIASSLGRLVEHGVDEMTCISIADDAMNAENRRKYDFHATRIQAAFCGWKTRMRTWDPNTELGAGLLRAQFHHMVVRDVKEF